MRFSISQIKNFKACRRSYYFRYVEGLEPIEKAEALQTGTNYHELIEWLNDHGSFDGCEESYSKEQAMATAYEKYIYPKVKVKSAEDWVTYPLTSEHQLFGRVDGIAEDGRLVEHKTTSMEITEAYEYNLQWDEQMLAYMLMTGAREIYYTVCRKPTIRQKKGESDEEFFNRMVEWYDEDTDSKIKLLILSRTDEEVEQFRWDAINICNEIAEVHDNPDRLYRNCGWCNIWGRRCEYSSICLHYDKNADYIEFERKERR